MATFVDRQVTGTVVTVYRPEEEQDPFHEGRHNKEIAETLGKLVAVISGLPVPISCIFFHDLVLELLKFQLKVMDEGTELMSREGDIATEEEDAAFREELMARMGRSRKETEAVLHELQSRVMEAMMEMLAGASSEDLPPELAAMLGISDLQPHAEAEEDLPDVGELDLDQIFADAGLDDEAES